MPLDCGLSSGVVQGTSPTSLAKRRVPRAREQLPLSVSHSTSTGKRLTCPNLCSTAASMRSRTSSPVMPLVVGTKLMASRSQQSRAKATRTRSPLSQPISRHVARRIEETQRRAVELELERTALEVNVQTLQRQIKDPESHARGGNCFVVRARAARARGRGSRSPRGPAHEERLPPARGPSFLVG